MNKETIHFSLHMAAIPSKADLLSELNSLNYDDRSRRTTLLGVLASRSNSNADRSAAEKLISELRDHPARPTKTTVSLENTVTTGSVVPTQQRLVEQNYHEYQASLNIAAGLGASVKHVFVDELNSGSTRFIQMAVTQASRKDMLSDDEYIRLVTETRTNPFFSPFLICSLSLFVS